MNKTKARFWRVAAGKTEVHPKSRPMSAARNLPASTYATGELGLPDPMLFIQEEDYPSTTMSRDQERR